MLKSFFKYILLLIFVFILKFTQATENDWIRYDLEYFRINISETGLHRLYPDVLSEAGAEWVVTYFNQAMIFYKGEQIPIFTKISNVESLEYIEFYAYKNDGLLDSALYADPSFQANPYYSLINDTASYYLTWDSTPEDNLRMEVENESNVDDYSEFNFCTKITLHQYTSVYYVGIRDPEYVIGEGYFSTAFSSSPLNITINTPNAINISGEKFVFEFCVAGVPATENQASTPHSLEVNYTMGNFDTIFTKYNYIKKRLEHNDYTSSTFSTNS